MINLSISNLCWNAEQNSTIYTLMRQYGFVGLEIAPTKIIPNAPYTHIAEAVDWTENLCRALGFCVPSMQSIWYGKSERIFASEMERNSLLNYTKSAIDFASAISCKNLVFGCPKNRNVPNDKNFAECNKIAVEFFKHLGDYAFSKGTCIGMEANPPIYGTNFINTTEEALVLIKEVDSDGFKLNLDVGTMIQNDESIDVLNGNIALINHVHISEPFLKKIEKRNLHNELIHLLKSENYKGYVSIEMGLQEKLGDIENILGYLGGLVNE